MSHYEFELKTAVELVRNATQITEWFKLKGFNSFNKDDNTPVTLADYASQIYIISELRDTFPDDKIIAEEGNLYFVNSEAENLIKECLSELDIGNAENIKDNITYRGVVSERQWTIDPIDGTMGYQKGLSYAVGIGFMIKSDPTICAIAVPNYKEDNLAIFSAESGQGAQMSYDNGTFSSIHVSQKTDFKDFIMCHSLHYDKPWVVKFARKIGVTKFVQIDSMAKFCMIADGSADLYIKPLRNYPTSSWDFLPGDLLVREAGGHVSDLNGDPLKYIEENCLWTLPGIISSNSIVHDKLIVFL
ncbi:MAG: inositol monophosphatase family protein [Promethearchaeota archaeon]|jgi:3'-phosphoadenosine 5'-phosphosulfate (PAPS) 3'-phosphatase